MRIGSNGTYTQSNNFHLFVQLQRNAGRRLKTKEWRQLLVPIIIKHLNWFCFSTTSFTLSIHLGGHVHEGLRWNEMFHLFSTINRCFIFLNNITSSAHVRLINKEKSSINFSARHEMFFFIFCCVWKSDKKKEGKYENGREIRSDDRHEKGFLAFRRQLQTFLIPSFQPTETPKHRKNMCVWTFVGEPINASVALSHQTKQIQTHKLHSVLVYLFFYFWWVAETAWCWSWMPIRRSWKVSFFSKEKRKKRKKKKDEKNRTFLYRRGKK